MKQDVDVVFQLDGDREWRGTGLSSKKKIAGNTFCNWGHKVCSSQKETFKRNRRVKYVCKACKSEMIEKRKRKYRSCRAELGHLLLWCQYHLQTAWGKCYLLQTQWEHTCHISPVLTCDSNEIVQSLHYDIYGDVVYSVSTVDSSNPWQSLFDGRKWGRYKSRDNGLGNKINQRDGIGRTASISDDCVYYRRFGRYNTSQFEKNKEESLCRECWNQTTKTPCHAKKPSYHNALLKKIIIRHEGTHICTPMKNAKVCTDKINELIHLFPSVKPAVAANTILGQSALTNSKPDEISTVSRSLLDSKKIKRVKNQTR